MLGPCARPMRWVRAFSLRLYLRPVSMGKAPTSKPRTASSVRSGRRFRYQSLGVQPVADGGFYRCRTLLLRKMAAIGKHDEGRVR